MINIDDGLTGEIRDTIQYTNPNQKVTTSPVIHSAIYRVAEIRKFQDISQSFFDFLEKYLFFYERNLVLLHFRVICIACRYILSI